MTEAQFLGRWGATAEVYPNLSSDTLFRLNREVFARVADLNVTDPGTDQAVRDAFAEVIEEL